MKENNITKIKFDAIRKKWSDVEEKWYFSVVDVVGLITKSSNPRNYWKVFKNRLKIKQNKLVTECNQLKLEAPDGKFYLTDVGNLNTMGKILDLLSPQNTLPFKAWAMNLTRPKEIEIKIVNKKSIGNEIYFKNKQDSYPQVKYNLLNLMNKNSKDPNLE